jgi:AcrR family transcriptional regulator
VGRKRVHGEATAAALLDAAEAIVESEGVEALTVRRVADQVGTTTRAIYSTLGSKEALLSGLGERAFEMLGAAVAALPHSDDPAADLVAAGMVFRRFALTHPALFRVGFRVQDSVPQEVAARLEEGHWMTPRGSSMPCAKDSPSAICAAGRLTRTQPARPRGPMRSARSSPDGG